jgi:hypothetical protein
MSGGPATRPRSEEPWQNADEEYKSLINRLASGMRTEKPNLPSAETLPPPAPVAPPNTPLQGMLMPKGKVAWKEMHDSKEGVSYFMNPATGEKVFLRDALNDPELGERAYKLLQYQEAQRKKGITGGK